LRAEQGIGLIELLIALTILAVGVSATTAVSASSLINLQHASKEGTAITLADRQLESYRAMPFACLPTTSSWSIPSGCATPSGFPNPYSASQTTTSADSPDHRLYTVTTALSTPSTGTLQVTVTVRLSSGGNDFATETSYFSSNGTSGTG
jgi:prepilin-type N-terminal cleavage/methylation domain-containing protein